MALVERPQTDLPSGASDGDAALQQHAPAAEAPAEDPAAAIAIEMLARLDAELTRDPTSERAALLHYERAHLLERPLGRDEEALAGYHAALALLPGHAPSLRGVRRCALRLDRADEALDALADEVAVASGAPHKAALLRLRARLVEGEGAEAEAARAAWEAVLAFVPEDLTALRALERLGRVDDDVSAHAEAVAALGGATRVAPELRATLLVRRARLAERAGDIAAAIDFHQRALLCSPEAPGAASALARLLAASGRWMELVAVLEAEVNRVDDPATKVALLLEIARVTEGRLADDDAALRVLERAATVAPQSAPVLDELARHYARDQRWAALREVLERRAHGLAAVDERVAAWSTLAELCATRLGDDAAAEQWFRAALSLDANHARSLRGLGAVLERQERWRDAIEVTLQEADAAISADLRAAACARAGATAEQRLADPAFAIGQHERALTLVPGYPPSYAALVRLYDETGRIDDRIALHERAAGWAATPADAIHQLFMAASLYETRLGAPRHAVAIYERVLTLAPDRVDALHALQRAADDAAMFPELLAAIDRELALQEEPGAPSTARRVALELRAAAINADAFGAPDRAVARYRRALALDPGCPAAWDALEQLFRRLGRTEDLAGALDALLEREPAGPGAVARLLELARLHEDELGRPGAALAYLERALHQRPRDREVLTALAATLGRAELYPRQAEILSLLVEVTDDPTAQADLACQLGDLARERLGDPWLAADSYERALAAQLAWRPARDALARLATDPATAEEARVAVSRVLVRALTRDATRAKDPAEQRQIRLSAIHHLVDGLGDTAAAATRLDEVLAAQPADLAALVERESLLRDGDDPAATVALGSALAEAVAVPAIAVPILIESAWTAYAHGIGDPTVPLWRALELQPGHDDALLLLEQIAHERGDDSLSRRVDARLVAAAPVAAAATMGDRFSRLAETLEARGEGGALMAWMDAVQATPGSLSAAWGLYRVAEREGDVETVAVALEYLAESTSDASEAADLLARLGRVRGGSLRDPEGEIEALDAALARCPDHVAAATRLVEIARRADTVRMALPVLRRAARGATNPARASALWRQVGAWHEAPLGERGAAIAAYEEAVAADASDASLLEHLAELYLRDAQNEEAVRCLEAAIEQTDDPARCRGITRRLAEVVAAFGDESLACGLLDDVLSEDPDDLAARRQRLDLYRSLGRRPEAVAECRLLIAGASDDERATLYQEVAALLDDEGDADGAFAARLEAVALEGPRGAAAAGCQSALTGPEAGERYLAALERWAEVHAEAVDAAFHRETARIRVQVLGRPEEGLDALVAAVSSSPSDLTLRETLVRTLVLGDEAEEAVVVARDLVLEDSSRVSAWRALRAAFVAAGEEPLARRALGGIVAAGGASDAEREELAQSPDRWVTAGMTPEALRVLGEERQESWATERLLAELSEHVELLEPDALDVLRLEQCESIEPDIHPLWAEADRIARVFGVESFTLYGAAEPGGRVQVGPGSRVVVPAGFHTAPPSVRRFELARAFALVGRGLEPVEVLGAGLLRAMIAAAERLVNPDVPEPSGLRPGLVDDLTRRLQRAVPRRARGHIEDCAADALREGPSDVLLWRTAWSRTAVRAALLVTGDLGAALPRIASSWGSDGVRDAIGFWVSPLADRMRSELAARAAGGGSRGW